MWDWNHSGLHNYLLFGIYQDRYISDVGLLFSQVNPLVLSLPHARVILILAVLAVKTLSIKYTWTPPQRD